MSIRSQTTNICIIFRETSCHFRRWYSHADKWEYHITDKQTHNVQEPSSLLKWLIVCFGTQEELKPPVNGIVSKQTSKPDNERKKDKLISEAINFRKKKDFCKSWMINNIMTSCRFDLELFYCLLGYRSQTVRIKKSRRPLYTISICDNSYVCPSLDIKPAIIDRSGEASSSHDDKICAMKW